jgi:RNA polymerase sigma-70 factor (ECF subfamily)
MKSFTGTDTALMSAKSPTIPARAILEPDFERLLAQNGAALTRLAASYTNTVSDRDDLLQEIAIATWQALHQFRGDCSERTFLFRIAHNRGITHLARRREVTAGLEESDVLDPAPNPESDLAQRQRADRLRQAVRCLPIAYRQVIVLTLEGLSYREISEVLGISESNVGVRSSRARRLLQDLLENRK